MIGYETVAAEFPFAAFKDNERGEVECALRRCVDAYGHCAGTDYGGDEEELMDDLFELLKPSEDEELLYLRVMDAMLGIVIQ